MPGHKILIADRDPLWTDKLKKIFEDNGYQVSLAQDGREALKKASEDQSDLILLEAGLSGVEQLRAGKDTPVIFMVGTDKPKEREEALQSGASDTISRDAGIERAVFTARAGLKINKIERALKEAESAYRVIFENSAVAITVADEEGLITLWNKFTEDMLGRNKEQLLLQNVSSLYPAEEWERIRRENIRQKGMQHHFETRMFKGDGKCIDVDISISVLKDAGGKISGSIGVIRDISERKLAEEVMRRAKEAAESANRTKGAFLHKLSQEVVKPMDTIIRMLDAALSTELSPKQKEALNKAKESADSLKIILDDIYLVFKELKEEKFFKVD
jgi:PAS domain S-box-containing protein